MKRVGVGSVLSDLQPVPSTRAADEAIGFWGYVYLFARRWWVVALCATASVAGVWWVERSKPLLYTAAVLVMKQAVAGPLVAVGVVGGASPEVSADRIASQIEILLSRGVLGPVVDSLDLRLDVDVTQLSRSRAVQAAEVDPGAPSGSYLLAADGEEGEEVVLLHPLTKRVLARTGRSEWLEGPGFRLLAGDLASLAAPLRIAVLDRESAIGSLRGGLQVEQVRGTALMRLKYTSPDPVLSADLVNAVALAYQEHEAERGKEEATRRRAFIGDQLAQVYDSLHAAQNELQTYQDSAGTIDPEVEAKAFADALMFSENELRDQRFQESVLQGLILSLRRDGDVEPAFERIVALGDLLPSSGDLYQRLQSLQADRSRLTASRYGYTEAGPEVEVLDSLIADAKQKIRGIAEESLRLMRSRKDASEGRVRELRQQVGEVPGRSTGFTRLEQRIAGVQGVFDMLVEKYYEAQIAEAVEAGDVKIVDRAPPPLSPDPRRTRPKLAIALVVGLLIGSTLVFLLEYMDTKIKGAQDAQLAASLAVIAYIPKLQQNQKYVGGPLIVGDRPGDPGAESFRVLRTHLRFVRTERPRLVAVTSPGPSEGKSTVALNLARSLAHEGHRVLLIDADLRRPSIHEVFELERAPGLSDVLVGECKGEDAFRFLPEEPLAVLTCGSVVPNPAELLGGPSLRSLLLFSRESFDTVVIDTPPVLAVTDALVLGAEVEGTLVVARTAYTDRKALTRGVDELRMVGAPLLGLVVNAVPTSGAYGHYAGYYTYTYYASVDGKRKRRGPLGRIQAILSRTS
ncbi:MAG: polysaccharide biosynthesis tyrosine autokinase [Gemmatimonadetes bacterium]|nr:polysaccharide biosynthesis tyrosine autokinase [Gemmatimonadota bacterium]